MKWDNFVAGLLARERVAANLLRARLEIGPGTGRGYVPIQPGDESVAFYFSRDGEELHARASERPNALGGWEIADEERSTGHRNYTVRSYDPETREMVVDFAEHAHGPAIDWLRAAEPGWRVLGAGPRSWYSPPRAAHHILAGDLAALPALARILEQTDPSVRVTVVAEVLDRSEIAYLPEHPNAEIVELVGTGNGVARTQLASTLAEIDLSGDAYCWLSGESADTRAAKKHLEALGWTRDRYDIVGYWRQDAEVWTARFDERGEELLQVFQNALDEGRSREEATDLYEAALEAAGL
ncbi:siderophore-interacting protein [Nocardia puris]|uniref:NADPH-dependent ferric siderophore reductase n=1 Tax=Nocardia puris TaxID=208602 RepID=A0A366DVH0_9NOCA|nr:siderophore-interacting protein [Nocardia puris]MBF6210655.1 siderophore-interacting protein [Nocardia puris]MBF6369381.1 siderophore-interacting protein [Nocardia puris]MBF6457916.1 siderophore-interacting protein [Nocardia puris]RBO94086.1 NADPH-dependent ferric siderophore reductase [Nocardia puris]